MNITPNTEVRLLSNVPLTNDYQHQMSFDSVADQSTFFLGKTSYTSTECTYQRDTQAIRYPKGRDSLYACNYVMYRNTDFSNRWFYGFITKLEYVNPNTTHVYFELDVFQTWQFDFWFKSSFVEREHCNRWNSDGTPVVNTVDEGLNYGTEYDNVTVTNYQPNNGFKFLVIVAKTPMHQGVTLNTITPTVLGTPTPLTVYLVPFKDNNTVPQVVATTGAGVLISKPTDVLTNLYSDTTAVNNIVSLYITDYTGIPVTVDSENTMTFSGSGGNEVLPAQIKDGSGNFFNCLYVKTVQQFVGLVHEVGDRYDGYNPVNESKLLMYPYTQLVLMDFKGNHAVYKNEYINNDKLNLIVKGGLGSSNKTSYGVQYYNAVSESQLNAMSDETALINNEANDIPIIHDLLSAYIQGNKNTIANEKNSIKFNGAMDMLSSGINGVMGAAMMGPMGAAGGIVEAGRSGGNTILQMQAINAKMQDINSVPPNISKQGSNTSYTIGNGYDGLYIVKKQIKPEYIRKLESFFKMYGYKLNEMKIPNYKTREHYNYLKTIGSVLFGNVPREDLDTLEKIFDNGITIWHGDWVCDYTLANGEV
jgi:hypothetical protein